MADERYPPYWRRSVVVVHRPVHNPGFGYIVWCGECHRIVNAYTEPTEAATAAHVHHDRGGHRTMPDPQNITTDPVREALVEFIAEQTGETNPVDVRLTPSGDVLVVTYKHGEPPTQYAALIVDDATRALIDAHVHGDSPGAPPRCRSMSPHESDIAPERCTLAPEHVLPHMVLDDHGLAMRVWFGNASTPGAAS